MSLKCFYSIFRNLLFLSTLFQIPVFFTFFNTGLGFTRGAYNQAVAQGITRSLQVLVSTVKLGRLYLTQEAFTRVLCKVRFFHLLLVGVAIVGNTVFAVNAKVGCWEKLNKPSRPSLGYIWGARLQRSQLAVRLNQSSKVIVVLIYYSWD